MRAGARNYKLKTGTVKYKFGAGDVKYKLGPEPGARARVGGWETLIPVKKLLRRIL